MSRLSHAIETGVVELPDAGTIALVGPPGGYDLAPLPRDRVLVVSNFRPDLDTFEAAGVPTAQALPPPSELSLVVFVLGRAKALNRGRLAEAARAGVPVVVDGARTDGIDSLYRDARALTPVSEAVAKDHGKVFTFGPTEALGVWLPAPSRVEGFQTVPGVFSADGIDPGSALLAAMMPPLNGQVADLGAGWGYLSYGALAASEAIDAMHLVEADADALECARTNVTDPRAVFHWADARTWRPAAPLDAVVMNPPFHTDRRADPALGQSFIRAAAGMLAPRGALWLVANRHLPYESTLDAAFRDMREVGDHPAFKVFVAERPRAEAGKSR